MHSAYLMINGDYNNFTQVSGMDRPVCLEGQICLSIPYMHDRFFFLHALRL